MSEADYIFHYPIDSEARDRQRPSSRNRCLEVIREQLENLLNLIIPCSGDTDIHIDGFKLLNNPSEIHRLFQNQTTDHASAGSLPAEKDTESEHAVNRNGPRPGPE